jgi:hypothetical protein
MSKKKVKEVEDTALEVQPTEVVPVEPEPNVIDQLDVLEKATLLHNLATIIKDEKFKASVLSRPSGNIIYEIFKEATVSALKKIMSGSDNPDVQKETKLAVSLAETVVRLSGQLRSMMPMFQMAKDSPLVQVLATLAKQLGAQVIINDSSHAQTPMSEYEQEEIQMILRSKPKAREEFPL